MNKSNICQGHHRLMRTWAQMRIIEALSVMPDEKIEKIMGNVRKKQKALTVKNRSRT